MKLSQWIKTENPDSIPYRPNVPYTGDRFGLRGSNVGQPLHLGQDRGGNPNHILASFTGKLSWEYLGDDSAWGSIAHLTADSNPEIELQIAHSIRKDGSIEPININIEKGQELPIVAGNIGFSFGAHTHTELIIKHTAKNYAWLRHFGGLHINAEKSIDKEWLTQECSDKGLDYNDTYSRLFSQLGIWGIEEFWKYFAVRNSPLFKKGYRKPLNWGANSVLIADSRFFLHI